MQLTLHSWQGRWETTNEPAAQTYAWKEKAK